MQRFKSVGNVISPQQERTEPSGDRPCRRGVKSSLWREADGPGDLLRAMFGNATEPSPVISQPLWLTLLAPDIVEAILDGGQPPTLQLDQLFKPITPSSDERKLGAPISAE